MKNVRLLVGSRLDTGSVDPAVVVNRKRWEEWGCPETIDDIPEPDRSKIIWMAKKAFAS